MQRNFRRLFALSLLALAGSVSAGDVELYGLIDAALSYTHKDNGVDTSSAFTMKSGPNSQSRFGIRGNEKISDGLTVGFVLENGFDVDTGALGNGSRLFGREAQVNLSGTYGTLKLGRMGALMSGLGSTGIFGGTVSAFPSAKSTDVPNHKAVMGGVFSQHDNTVTYVTPSFANTALHLQYSTGRNVVTNGTTDTSKRENTSDVDRYAAAGLVHTTKAFKWVALVDQLNYAKGGTGATPKNAYTVSLGGNYDFGTFRLHAAAQYFKDAKPTISPYNDTKGATSPDITYADGFGAILSTHIPFGQHAVKLGAGYMHAESAEDSDIDMDRGILIAGYQYRFSKRTSFYATTGYGFDSYSKTGAEDANVASIESGLIHRF